MYYYAHTTIRCAYLARMTYGFIHQQIPGTHSYLHPIMCKIYARKYKAVNQVEIISPSLD